MAISQLAWSKIASAPDRPGTYAWYYAPELTQFDLDKTINALKALGADAKLEQGRQIVREFLEDRLFSYFREDPYRASVDGPLKPSYAGQLCHQISVSESLVTRLVDDPDRLILIREILAASAPMFASPLYIGMSNNLRMRLLTHKKLIEQFRANQNWSMSDEMPEDSSFARQIAKRRIPPTCLFVVVCVIESSGNIHVDIEHILNRIYYPILGRN